MTSTHSPTTAAASAAGSTLGAAFGVIAALRRTKPLHPRGVVVAARVERRGSVSGWGVPWLDDAGVDHGVARLSRSVGLPEGWPDVLGLSVRFTDDDGPHDLLLATTGMAPVARHVLVPRVDALSASYGSLFTYSTPHGQIVLGATPGDRPLTFAMHAATLTSGWKPFADLVLEADPQSATDDQIDFDPVVNPLPGMTLAPALAALREPAYAAARRLRPDTAA